MDSERLQDRVESLHEIEGRVNRRRFIATAATLPTLFQACRPGEAMGQERVYLTEEERLTILDAAIVQALPTLRAKYQWAKPMDVQDGYGGYGWHRVFRAYDFGGLTPIFNGYVAYLFGHPFNEINTVTHAVDFTELFANAADTDIGAQVERTLLDAAERFASEVQ